MVQFLSSPAGAHAVAFGAQPNFKPYNLLTVKDFSSGVALGLVFDLENHDNEIIMAARDYAKSSAWKKQLKKNDILPVD